MKEELFIIYYINVGGLSRQGTQENINQMIEANRIDENETTYKIHQIYVPVTEQSTHIDIINPKSLITSQQHIEELKDFLIKDRIENDLYHNLNYDANTGKKRFSFKNYFKLKVREYNLKSIFKYLE